MIVITGGAGFIGSNLVAALKATPSRIAVVDHLGHEQKWRNLTHSRVDHLIETDDLFSFLETHCNEITLIFHLGACSTTTETDVDYIIRNNFTLSLELWDFCKRNAVRLIYASSAATYGDGSQGFKDDESLEKLEALRPLNPYGWSKTLTDRAFVARAMAEEAPPQWVGLKFFNVYGPNEYHKGGQRSVAHQMFEQLQKTGKVRLFKSAHPDCADGEQQRDFVYVEDCVQHLLYLMDNPSINGVFNSGSGTARSFLDLAKACASGLELPLEIEWLETPPEIAKHYQYFTEADMTKLKGRGYNHPATSLEAGVKQYFHEFLLKEDSYR